LEEKSDLKYVFTLPSYWELGRGRSPVSYFLTPSSLCFYVHLYEFAFPFIKSTNSLNCL